MKKTTFKKGVNQSRNMETMIFANKNRLRMEAGAKSPRFHLLTRTQEAWAVISSDLFS